MFEIDVALTRQWSALRAWLEVSGALHQAAKPSVLDGWTVGDLTAHTGRSFLALEQTTDEPDEHGDPQTLLQYVSNYAPAADDIAEGTRQLATDIGADLLAGIDGLAGRGFAALARLRGPVVRGPRGLITRDDMALTRLLELVVHGDDLARSLPDLPPPDLLDDAVARVSIALADAYTEATGRRPAAGAAITWIRSATGRTASNDPDLPLL